MKALCFLPALLWLFPACSPPKSEEVGYYPNGAISYRVALTKEGVYTGICTNFYPSGGKQNELPFLNGHINGVVKRYYLSGQLMSTARYQKGKNAGEMKSYYPTGELRSQGRIFGATPIGPVVHYYRNGRLQHVQIHDKRGKVVDFARFFPTGGIDAHYTQPMVYSLLDTVQVGQVLAFEVVLACRTSNAVQVRMRGEQRPVDSVKGEFSPYRYLLKATRPGRVCLQGGVLQPRTAKTSTWFPWQHCFFVTTVQLSSGKQ
jgi:antitoxin component YwqK of YwqJK toxin-antitoxin module